MFQPLSRAIMRNFLEGTYKAFERKNLSSEWCRLQLELTLCKLWKMVEWKLFSRHIYGRPDVKKILPDLKKAIAKVDPHDWVLHTSFRISLKAKPLFITYSILEFNPILDWVSCSKAFMKQLFTAGKPTQDLCTVPANVSLAYIACFQGAAWILEWYLAQKVGSWDSNYCQLNKKFKLNSFNCCTREAAVFNQCKLGFLWSNKGNVTNKDLITQYNYYIHCQPNSEFINVS